MVREVTDNLVSDVREWEKVFCNSYLNEEQNNSDFSEELKLWWPKNLWPFEESFLRSISSS